MKLGLRVRTPAVVALAALTLLVGCASGSQGSSVLVFAAASLTDPMTEIAARFQEETGIEVRASFDGSMALAQRVRRGAPADVLFAAGERPVQLLEQEGRIKKGSRVDLVRNRLVIVVSKGSDLNLTSMKDLEASAIRRIAIADPGLAPAGAYAREALQSLDLWKSLQPKIIPGAHVRATLGYVEGGSAEAGIVYQTDASISEQVKVALTVPQDSHRPIVYPVAVLQKTRSPETATRFVDYLQSEEAAGVFRQYGFTPLN